MAGTFTNQLQPGMKVGKYQIVSLVATGGMAMLYKAYDKTLDRYVAIKQIAPNLAADEKFVERFRREAQVLARVSQGQQNVVAVFELIEEGGGLFMVMEFVEGASLQALLDRGAASLQTGLGILLKIALGLKAIHSQGLVHRDLKPDNVMVQASGGVKIADFGLIGRAGGRTSLPMGTTQYMAPEMFSGSVVDGRADIYSLGFIAYQMFVGPEKFHQIFADVLADPQSANIRWMHWHSNPQLKAVSLREAQPGVPPLVARVVERMMEKDPAKRFNSVDQIIKWLRQIFVMYVQGQSLSEQDSARLEQEVDQEIEGATAPARAATTAVVRRGEAAPPAVEGQAGPLQPLKTAPLAKRPWHWQDYAKWGGVAAGVLLLAGIALAVVKNMQINERVDKAEAYMTTGKAKFNEGKWAEAVKDFEFVDHEFRPDLPDTADSAYIWGQRAKVNESIDKADWDQADQRNQALKKFAEPWPESKNRRTVMDYVSENDNRITRKRHVAQMRDEINRAVQNKDFLKAVDLIDQILAEGLSEDPQALQDEKKRYLLLQDEKEADVMIAEGDTKAARGVDSKRLDQARALYSQADAKFPGPKAKGRIKMVDTALEILGLMDTINKNIQEQKWSLASANCDEVARLLKTLEGMEGNLQVINRADLEQKTREAKSNALFEQAKAMVGSDPKKAVELLDQVQKIDPAHKGAAALKNTILGKTDMDTWQQEALKAEKERRYDDARDLYEKMKAKETDAGLKQVIQGYIDTVMQKKFRKEFDQALKDRNWEAAKAALDGFIANKGKGGDADWMDRQLRNLRLYWEAFDEGEKQMKLGIYGEGIKAFKTAGLLPVGPEMTNKALEKVRECEYLMFMKQGADAEKLGKFGEARAYYSLAKLKKDTQEVRDAITRCGG